jgi:hypothetical protein
MIDTAALIGGMSTSGMGPKWPQKFRGICEQSQWRYLQTVSGIGHSFHALFFCVYLTFFLSVRIDPVGLQVP